MKKQIASTIFLNSFQKEIRNKTFWVLLISSILVMLAGRAFFKQINAQFTQQGALQQFDIYVYYFIISVWSGLMTALLGINCIKSDTRYGMSEQILAFPIRSESYLFLRVAGTSLMVWFFNLILFGMMAIFLMGPTFPLGYRAIIAFIVSGASTFVVVLLACLWSVILGQISGFIALFFSTLIISYINRNIGQMDLLFYPGAVIHWLIPHLGTLGKISNDLIFEPQLSESIKLWLEIPHFILSTAFLFWVTHFIFKKRGFK